MGWSGGQEIFERVAGVMIRAAEGGLLDPMVAREIASTLIAEMQMNDWDTDGDALMSLLYEHGVVPWLIFAFEDNDVHLTDREILDIVEARKTRS